MGDLYAADILAWSEDQAALLRRAAAGERVGGIDPSMAQRINLARLFRSALEQARDEADASGAPCRLPDTCPFTLDALLAGDMPELVAALTKPD